MSSKISFFGLDDWSVAVCAWRGCCLEVFARAEHSVADCLRALEKVGLALGRDARHNFGGTRLKALAACIESYDFGGHGRVAQKRITAWEEVYELRAYLAHGTVKASGDGIVIQHTTYDGKAEKPLPPRKLSRIEMLTTLHDIEQAQRLLHQQLGHIKALAKSAKPVMLAKKPSPGSGPG